MKICKEHRDKIDNTINVKLINSAVLYIEISNILKYDIYELRPSLLKATFSFNPISLIKI